MIASSSTFDDVFCEAIHAVAGFEQLGLEIDESLRQSAHGVVETGTDAADRCIQIGDLDPVVLVDPVFHRHCPIDHLHVDGVDALRQDLTMLGQLTGYVRAGLVDNSAQVAEALLDRSRDRLIAVVHPPVEGYNRFVDVCHGRRCLLVEAAAALVQIVDLRLDRRGLVLEVVAQAPAHHGELRRQLGLNQCGQAGELAVDGRQRLMLMVGEFSKPFFQRGL